MLNPLYRRPDQLPSAKPTALGGRRVVNGKTIIDRPLPEQPLPDGIESDEEYMPEALLDFSGCTMRLSPGRKPIRIEQSK